MEIFNNIFLGKKILIYGLGKSGISSYKFLRDISKVYIFDDNKKKNFNFDQKQIKFSEITKIVFFVIFFSIKIGLPIFPVSLTSFFWSKRTSCKIFAVVDFPFVPVIVILSFL